jgi:hypothetical protein
MAEYFCTGIFLQTEYVVLGYTCWLSILYWNVPTVRVFCTGLLLLTECFVPDYSYWLSSLPWHITTD